MNGTAAVERVWSRQRWIATVTAFFFLQAGLTWWLSDRRPMSVRGEDHRLQVRLAATSTDAGFMSLLELKDPTLFVLPGRNGFSGKAWLEVKPLQHRSPGWSNPPQWLQLNPGEMLADFARFAATNQQPGRAYLSGRSSRPAEPRLALGETDLPARGTRMQITGRLSERDLTSGPELPVVEHPGVLAPTVVSIFVDQQGRVFAARLAAAGSSGSSAADKLGLELARSLRFVPDPRISPAQNARDFDRLREARVVFHWWTRAPAPATNAPPAKPPPSVRKS